MKIRHTVPVISMLFAALALGGCATSGTTTTAKSGSTKPVKVASASTAPAAVAATPTNPGDFAVKISAKMASADVMHEGKKFTIQRNQNPDNTVNPAFAKTSRKCPPFCIQPGVISPGVETIGELEVIGYLKKMSDGDKSVLVVDSRTPDWFAKGSIPGAVNISWEKLNIGKTDPFTIEDILSNQFGGKLKGDAWDFSNARTLVMYCNGMWCGQSPTNIKALIGLGYPADKIKWYRGGMQDWEILGLSVVKPAGAPSATAAVK